MTTETEANDLIVAAADLIGRCGAENFELTFCDESAPPLVWIAIATFPGGICEVGGALNPERAAFRLLTQLVDGGQCKHCGKRTGVNDDFTNTPPLPGICWYEYDPEVRKYRRACE